MSAICVPSEEPYMARYVAEIAKDSARLRKTSRSLVRRVHLSKINQATSRFRMCDRSQALGLMATFGEISRRSCTIGCSSRRLEQRSQPCYRIQTDGLVTVSDYIELRRVSSAVPCRTRGCKVPCDHLSEPSCPQKWSVEPP